MAEGQGESAEAETVREGMFDSWRLLTAEEVARLDGLSADLYMLTEEEFFVKTDPAERTRARLGPRLRTAWQRRDWDEVLALLRTDPDFLDRAQLAYLRGRCWAEFGHHDVALLFFDYAARLKPENVSYQMLALEELLQLGQLDQAHNRVRAFSAAEDGQFLQVV
jgi:tetratricopeptide (TPR) repeat protein